MRLSVIGCGHLGAVHAACMADRGYEVLGVDIEGKTEMLNSGKAWFREPGLDEMLPRNVAEGRLRFTTSFAEAAKFAPVRCFGVATPGLPAGTYDLLQLRMAVAELVQHITGPGVIIGKSTVPLARRHPSAQSLPRFAGTAFNQRSMRRFGTSLRRAIPKGHNLHLPCSIPSRALPTKQPSGFVTHR